MSLVHKVQEGQRAYSGSFPRKEIGVTPLCWFRKGLNINVTCCQVAHSGPTVSDSRETAAFPVDTDPVYVRGADRRVHSSPR